MVRPGSILAALMLLAPLWAVGADRSDARALPAVPVTAPESFSGTERAPADAESQLREIEGTKRLMKELGAMHGGGVIAPAAKPDVPGGAAQGMPAGGVSAPLDVPAKDPGTDLISNPDVRESVKAAVGVINQVAGSPAPSSANAGRGGVSDAAPETSRPQQPGDENRFSQLLDSLVDEMLPWAVGFVVLFLIGYGGISLVSGRSAGAARPASSRARRRSRRSGGSESGRDTSGRRRSRSLRTARRSSSSEESARPPSA